MSAFCQGFTSLLEIERHTFSALKSLSAFLNRMAVAISFRRCRYVLAHVAWPQRSHPASTSIKETDSIRENSQQMQTADLLIAFH